MHFTLPFSDPCPEAKKALIFAKSYKKELAVEYQKRGLVVPSGMIIKLIKQAEKWLFCPFNLHEKNLVMKIVNGIISHLHTTKKFDGFPMTDCLDDWTLAQMIIEKFVSLRVGKVFKDLEQNKDKGNYLQRSRIFQHVWWVSV